MTTEFLALKQLKKREKNYDRNIARNVLVFTLISFSVKKKNTTK